MKPNIRLKQAREQRGWSQAKVAHAVGIDRVSVSRWERGIATPYPHYREKLCALFGKDARELGLVTEQREESVSPSSNPIISFQSSQEKQTLIGREPLLNVLLTQLITTQGPHVRVFYGLPGVGKTALVSTLIRHQMIRQHFSGGILWAGLGPQTDILEILRQWAYRLQPSGQSQKETTSKEDWMRTLRSLIGSKRILIVIDDLWRIEDALALQIGGSHCTYLITTRFPQLGIQLAGEGATVLPELEEQEGLELLAHFIPEILSQEPELARQLVHSVGSLPLALILIGHYLQLQATNDPMHYSEKARVLLQCTHSRLRLGSSPSPSTTAESLQTSTTSPSLYSIIALSERYLTSQASKALRALSLLPAKPQTFSEEVALAISQQPPEILDQLSDAGLLEGCGPGRYTLHSTIADYARSQLSEQETEKLRLHLIECATAYAETYQDNYQALAQEHSFLMTGHEMAWHYRMYSTILKGVRLILPYLHHQDLFLHCEGLLKRGEIAAIATQNSVERICILQSLGENQYKKRNYIEAEIYLEKGLLLAEQEGFPTAIFQSLLAEIKRQHTQRTDKQNQATIQ